MYSRLVVLLIIAQIVFGDLKSLSKRTDCNVPGGNFVLPNGADIDVFNVTRPICPFKCDDYSLSIECDSGNIIPDKSNMGSNFYTSCNDSCISGGTTGVTGTTGEASTSGTTGTTGKVTTGTTGTTGKVTTGTTGEASTTGQSTGSTTGSTTGPSNIVNSSGSKLSNAAIGGIVAVIVGGAIIGAIIVYIIKFRKPKTIDHSSLFDRLSDEH